MKAPKTRIWVNIALMATSSSAIPLGSGRYEVRNPDPLGTGHFGEVYDGRDTYLDRRVAIKLFKDGFAPDQAIVEAATQAKLSDHPNIVAIHDVVPEPPRPFMALEFIAGGSVGDRLERGEVSLVDAARWTRDGLAGLAHAHRLGVLHRDLKPGNLLVLPNGDAALSDFGLAEDSARMVSASDLIYLAYASPELEITGSSAATEIWAAGCTLYRLITNEYAFEPGDDEARHRGDFNPVHELEPQVPRQLRLVIEKALALDPGERFEDADQMRSALLACRIRYSWSRFSDPDAVEAWEITTDDGALRVRLIDRPRAGPQLIAQRDKGSGFRQIRAEQAESLAKGRQRLWVWLRHVVQGNAP